MQLLFYSWKYVFGYPWLRCSLSAVPSWWALTSTPTLRVSSHRLLIHLGTLTLPGPSRSTQEQWPQPNGTKLSQPPTTKLFSAKTTPCHFNNVQLWDCTVALSQRPSDITRPEGFQQLSSMKSKFGNIQIIAAGRESSYSREPIGQILSGAPEQIKCWGILDSTAWRWSLILMTLARGTRSILSIMFLQRAKLHSSCYHLDTSRAIRHRSKSHRSSSTWKATHLWPTTELDSCLLDTTSLQLQ